MIGSKVIALVAAGALAAAAWSWIAQRRAHDRFEARIQELQRRVESQALENDRLSSALAQARSAQSLSREQLAELMRSRSEIGALRQWQKELEADAQRRTTNSSAPVPAAASGNAPAVIPKKAWRFVGFDTPENAVESVLWSMSRGDVNKFLESLTPESKPAIARLFADKTQPDIQRMLAHDASRITQLRLDRKSISPDGAVSFVVYSAPDDAATPNTRDEVRMKFKNIGGQWRFDDR